MGWNAPVDPVALLTARMQARFIERFVQLRRVVWPARPEDAPSDADRIGPGSIYRFMGWPRSVPAGVLQIALDEPAEEGLDRNWVPARPDGRPDVDILQLWRAGNLYRSAWPPLPPDSDLWPLRRMVVLSTLRNGVRRWWIATPDDPSWPSWELLTVSTSDDQLVPLEVVPARGGYVDVDPDRRRPAFRTRRTRM